LAVALATAADVPRVPLPEALAICLLLRDQDPERYERAAVRWHSRLCAEARLSLTDASLAMAALMVIASTRPVSGFQALAGLAESYGLDDVVSLLDRRVSFE
jgi:hypothetical protein